MTEDGDPFGCPYCGGEALEITENGDRERRFVCNGWTWPEDEALEEPGCGGEWSEPFDDYDPGPVPSADSDPR